VETVAQVRNNVAIVERGPLDGDVVEAVEAMATGLSQRVLTPSRWNEGGTA
jgi:hypothetical protein